MPTPAKKVACNRLLRFMNLVEQRLVRTAYSYIYIAGRGMSPGPEVDNALAVPE